MTKLKVAAEMRGGKGSSEKLEAKKKRPKWGDRGVGDGGGGRGASGGGDGGLGVVVLVVLDGLLLLLLLVVVVVVVVVVKWVPFTTK